jgi:Outer membrane protein beta-barrel domain
MQGGKSGDNKLNLNYINIPLLAQYMTLDGFRFETGPQIGFLTAAKSKSGDVTVDVKDDLESVDISWAFGVGYLFPGGSGWGVDLRYNHGITNISEDNDFEARNRVFQLGVFYQLQKTHTHSGKRR